MIVMKIHIKKISIYNFILTIGVVQLMYLMLVFLNNAYGENLKSTQIVQLGLVFTGFLCILFLRKMDKFMSVSFLLSLSMFFSSVRFADGVYGTLDLFVKTFLWFFVAVLGYQCSEKKCDKIIRQLAFVTLIIMIIIFFNHAFMNFQVEQKNYVQTSIYYIICMLPFVFMIENEKLRLLLMGIVSLFTIISFKRSAIVVLVITLFILSGLNIKKFNYKVLLKYLFLIVCTMFIILVVYSKINNWELADFMDIFNVWDNRFNESNSRESIYVYTLGKQFESSGAEWLFGHGYNAVMKDSIYGLSSHCDYIEVLYNYGIIAECLYFYLIFIMLKRNIKLIKTDFKYSNGYLCAILIFIIASIPSHMLTYSTYFLLLSFFWGYFDSQANRYERERIRIK